MKRKGVSLAFTIYNFFPSTLQLGLNTLNTELCYRNENQRRQGMEIGGTHVYETLVITSHITNERG
jgi:hypothetical protein